MSVFGFMDSIWFLSVLILFAIVGCGVMVENYGKSGWFSFFLILGLFVLQFFSDIHPFTFIFSHPVESLILAAIYMVIGVGYLWAKWLSFVRTAVRRRNKYHSDRNIVNPTQEQDQIAARALGYWQSSFPLQVKNYKEQLFGWCFYWPISAPLTILNDPIKRLWLFIYGQIGTALQKISDDAFDA